MMRITLSTGRATVSVASFFLVVFFCLLSRVCVAQDGASGDSSITGGRYVLVDDTYGIYPLTVDLKPGQAAHFLVSLPPRSSRWTTWEVQLDTRGFSNDQLYVDGGKLTGSPTVEGQIKKMPIAGTYVPFLVLSGPGGKMVVKRTAEIRVKESFWGDYFNNTSGMFRHPVSLVLLIAVIAGLLGAFASLTSSVVTSMLSEKQRRQRAITEEKNRREDELKKRQKGLRLHLQKLILRIKEDVTSGTEEGVSFTDWAGEANDPSWNYLLYEEPASEIIKRTKETYMMWQLGKSSNINYEELKAETLNRLDDEFLNIVEIP